MTLRHFPLESHPWLHVHSDIGYDISYVRPRTRQCIGPRNFRNRPYAKAYSSDSYYNANPNKGSEMKANVPEDSV